LEKHEQDKCEERQNREYVVCRQNLDRLILPSREKIKQESDTSDKENDT
jgi:hypothetical protein